jgi:hypothetical protein
MKWAFFEPFMKILATNRQMEYAKAADADM